MSWCRGGLGACAFLSVEWNVTPVVGGIVDQTVRARQSGQLLTGTGEVDSLTLA